VKSRNAILIPSWIDNFDGFSWFRISDCEKNHQHIPICFVFFIISLWDRECAENVSFRDGVSAFHLFTDVSEIMNQTTWIIIGGVAVVLVAAVLYFFSGDTFARPLTAKDMPPAVSITSATSSDPVIPTVRTTPAPATAPKATAAKKDTEAGSVPAADPIVVLHTTMGDITIKLYQKDAPVATANFLNLASSGFYDGVKFHRVIKGFMIQSGDPLSKDDTQMNRWGTGGPGYAFENEQSGHLFVRGSLGMANSGGTNTNGSQFFVVTAQATPFLNGGYTNFGEVVSGLDVALRIENVQTDGSAQAGTGNDRPVNSVTITSVEVK
jgi:cyclophilin family peptidyl-prolyl cis-trans isomerase